METSFKLLYFIYILISLFNCGLMFIFYLHHDKNKRFLYALMIWIGNLSTIVLDALAISTNTKLALLTFWPDYFIVFSACLLLQSLFSINIHYKKFVFIQVLSYLTSIGLYFFFPENFSLVTFPMAAGVGLPLIYYSIKSLYKLKPNVVYELYLWVTMIWALHFLDYPFLRPDPNMALFGFSFSFILILTLSVLLPFIITMKLREESEDILNTRIETKKAELKLTVSDLINAQTKLLEQEKFISLATLTSGIAHEIRNPLNIILNSAKILERDSEKEGEDTSLLQLIVKNTERANLIIKNMLLKTTSIAHENENTEVVNLSELIKECIQKSEFDKNLSQKKIMNYKVNVPTDLKIKGKKTDLDSIFINLITNALYSIKEKHSKAIDNAPLILQINAYTKNNQVIVEVIDTGMGISTQNINKIFDPFFTTKPAGIGTGLGLSIIKIMVEGLNGKIEVNSRLGIDCKFSLTFPRSF